MAQPQLRILNQVEQAAVNTAKAALLSLKPYVLSLTNISTCQDWCRTLRGIEAAFADPAIPADLKPTVITKPFVFRNDREKRQYFEAIANVQPWAADVDFTLTTPQWKVLSAARNMGTLAMFSSSVTPALTGYPGQNDWHAAAVSLSHRQLFIMESEVDIN